MNRTSLLIFGLILFAGVPDAGAGDKGIEWSAHAPREEIRPTFENNLGASLQIAADHREGLNGWWQATITIQPGKHYRFTALRKTTGVDQKLVRRMAPARVTWLNGENKKVKHDSPTTTTYRPGANPQSEPEFPEDQEQQGDWTVLQGTYQVPKSATRARIELHFRWGPPHSKVEWKNIRLEQVEPQKKRNVKLAAIHFQPRDGKTAAEKREQFEPLIAKAAGEGADLIVLPETLTYYASGKTFAECAESIPGDSTEYFGELALKHKTHIVAGLLERDKHLIYNVAVLIGPDGKLIGKYRKVTLPRGEIERGITPGNEYPVFDTEFGKVGMMVCYDGFFPEVARELTKNGAEVIAWPVWGCNPMLGAARACENHVYVVSSTYVDADREWMITGIYDQAGKVLDQAKVWGEIAIAEVDLDKRMHWHNLGDFKAQIERHRPVLPANSK